MHRNGINSDRVYEKLVQKNHKYKNILHFKVSGGRSWNNILDLIYLSVNILSFLTFFLLFLRAQSFFNIVFLSKSAAGEASVQSRNQQATCGIFLTLVGVVLFLFDPVFGLYLVFINPHTLCLSRTHSRTF